MPPTRGTGLPRRNAVVTARGKAVVTAKGQLFGQLSFASVRIEKGADDVSWLRELRTYGAMVIVVEISAEAHEAKNDLVVDLANKLSKPSIGFSPKNRLKGPDRHGADWQREYICRTYGNTIIGYRKDDQVAKLTEVNQESSVEDSHTDKRMMVFQLDLTQCICGHYEVKFAVPLASSPMSSVDLADERQVAADVKYLIDNEVRVVFGNEKMGCCSQIIPELQHSARIHVLRPHPTDVVFVVFIGELTKGIRPSKDTPRAITWSNTKSLCQGKDYLELGEDWKDRDWKPIQTVDYKCLPGQPVGTSKVWIFWGAIRSHRSQKGLNKRANKRFQFSFQPVVTGLTRDTHTKQCLRQRFPARRQRQGPTKYGAKRQYWEDRPFKLSQKVGKKAKWRVYWVY